jgi:hypothetical protein
MRYYSYKIAGYAIIYEFVSSLILLIAEILGCHKVFEQNNYAIRGTINENDKAGNAG